MVTVIVKLSYSNLSSIIADINLVIQVAEA